MRPLTVAVLVILVIALFLRDVNGRGGGRGGGGRAVVVVAAAVVEAAQVEEGAVSQDLQKLKSPKLHQ